MENKDITFAGLFAAAYLVLGAIFMPISYMLIQVRVACALIPLIAIFGYPSVVGITIGHLIFNMYFASLGPYDLLSPIVFLLPRLLIAKYGVKVMPIHTVTVAVYVGWMGSHYMAFLGGTLTWMLAVFAGELIAEWYIGYWLLYHRVEKLL